MTYEEKKKEIKNKSQDLIKDYKVFYNKVMKLAAEFNDLNNFISTPAQMFDRINFSSDEEQEKITRLIVALLYVEKPNSKEIIKALLENIETSNELNSSKAK